MCGAYAQRLTKAEWLADTVAHPPSFTACEEADDGGAGENGGEGEGDREEELEGGAVAMDSGEGPNKGQAAEGTVEDGTAVDGTAVDGAAGVGSGATAGESAKDGKGDLVPKHTAKRPKMATCSKEDVGQAALEALRGLLLDLYPKVCGHSMGVPYFSNIFLVLPPCLSHPLTQVCAGGFGLDASDAWLSRAQAAASPREVLPLTTGLLTPACRAAGRN